MPADKTTCTLGQACQAKMIHSNMGPQLWFEFLASSHEWQVCGQRPWTTQIQKSNRHIYIEIRPQPWFELLASSHEWQSSLRPKAVDDMNQLGVYGKMRTQSWFKFLRRGGVRVGKCLSAGGNPPSRTHYSDCSYLRMKHVGEWAARVFADCTCPATRSANPCSAEPSAKS